MARGKHEGTVRERENGLIEARVTVGYTDDGKQKQMSKYFRGKKAKQEARAWLAEVQTEQNRGNFVAPDKVTVEQWIKKWLETYSKPVVEDTTFENYERVINVHIIPGLGKTPLQKLTPSDVQLFLNGKVTGGRGDGKKGGMSPRMVRYMHFLLQSALAQAKKDGLVVRNVAEDMILPKMSKKKKPTYLNTEEVDKFLDATKEDRLFPALLMEMGTGLRRGELLGLKWQDIDFEKGTVTVRRQLVRLKGGSVFHDHTKTEAGEREITLPEEVQDVLKFHRRRQDNEKDFCKTAYEDSGLVFCQATGRKINPRNFTRHFDKLLDDAGVKHIPFHATRHTHATELLAAGVDLKTIQERLGHSSFRVTADFYAHVAEELQKDAAAKINEVLKRGKNKNQTSPETTGKEEKTTDAPNVSRKRKAK